MTEPVVDVRDLGDRSPADVLALARTPPASVDGRLRLLVDLVALADERIREGSRRLQPV